MVDEVTPLEETETIKETKPTGLLTDAVDLEETAAAKPGATQPMEAPKAAVAQQATSVGYTPTTREVTPEETSAYQLSNLTNKDSPMAQRAKQTGYLEAAHRGLGESTLAAGAAFGEWVDRAQPFAIADAATYAKQGLANQEYQNLADKYTAEAANAASIANAQMGTQVAMANLSSQTQRFVQNMSNMSAESMTQWTNSTNAAITIANNENRIEIQNLADTAAGKRNMDTIASSEKISREANATKVAINDALNATKIAINDANITSNENIATALNQNRIDLQEMLDNSNETIAKANRLSNEKIADESNMNKIDVANLNNASREAVADIEAKNAQILAKLKGAGDIISMTIAGNGQIIANEEDPTIAAKKIKMNNGFAQGALDFLSAYQQEDGEENSTTPDIGVPPGGLPDMAGRPGYLTPGGRGGAFI